MKETDVTRINEWFVPKFGPIKFRIFVGMLFLPYTGMCISFTVIGSMLADVIYWNRVLAIAIIYFFALGISAHIADNLGSKNIKPWGNYFSKSHLKIIMITSILLAYSIGIYYIITSAFLLIIIAIFEGFFLYAYNYELFNGMFHNSFWFAISWGALPLLGGYIIQTNSISLPPLLLSSLPFVVSILEINMSKRYKYLKKEQKNDKNLITIKKLETGLKVISIGTILFTCFFIVLRYYFG